MKKEIIAFTMIELLVVISIISIISITSINGFFNFLQDKELSLKTNEIRIYIESLDKKVKNHEIYDYNILINTSINNSLISYENIYDTEKNITLSYNSGTNSGELTLNGSSGELWNLSIYKDKKLFFSNNVSGTNTGFLLEKNYNYKLLSTLSGASDINKLNTIDIIKFDKENSLLKLTKISTGALFVDIGDIEIRNIGGKKEFYNSGNILNSNEIFIYFENKGKENYLKLTK